MNPILSTLTEHTQTAHTRAEQPFHQTTHQQEAAQ